MSNDNYFISGFSHSIKEEDYGITEEIGLCSMEPNHVTLSVNDCDSGCGFVFDTIELFEEFCKANNKLLEELKKHSV